MEFIYDLGMVFIVLLILLSLSHKRASLKGEEYDVEEEVKRRIDNLDWREE